jgi:hypothetical protein
MYVNIFALGKNLTLELARGAEFQPYNSHYNQS